MNSVRVSVVIPAYFRPEILEKAVRSCMDQSLPDESYEIIVVDSSDNRDNVALIESLQSEARCSLVCLQKQPEGPGPSRNLGAEQARGEFLAFMDSDCQASRQWLEAGLAAFNEEVGLIQGRTMPDPDAAFGILSRSFRIEAENIIYEALNIFYRREAFLQQGGFFAEPDPNTMTVLGGEDVDLAWKVKRAGWQSGFASEALVTHIVERITAWQWLYDPRMVVVPRIPRDFPETRPYFFARYFFDDTQAWLLLALMSALTAWLSPFTLIATIPYILKRGTEHTRALPGVLRVFRVLLYLPKDLLTMVTLLRGCWRYKTILI